MRILVVNDDGIDAVGIDVLASTFAELHEVSIVAPEGERSGFSHSVTIFRDMRYYKTDRATEAYAISGTPADCVKFGVLHLFGDRRPDLVLSGINAGPNLGGDIMYSGTVAAASEAAYLGIPALAVSLGDWTQDKTYYTACAEFVKRNLDTLYAIACQHAGKAILSINYPCSEWKGAVFTKAGINAYDDYFEPQSEGVVQLKGMPVLHENEETDCDVAWIKKGYATITPLRIDRNHESLLEHLQKAVKLI